MNTVSPEITTFDQGWHHLCSTSAEGKDVSNDTQMRVIDPMDPELHKNAKKVE